MFMFHLTHWHSSIFKSIKSGLIRKNKANKWVTKINTSIGWKWKTKFGFISRKKCQRGAKVYIWKKKEKYSPDILRLVQVFESVTLIENRRTMLWFFISPVFLFCLFFSLTVVVFFSTNFKIPFVVNSCTSFLQSNERNRSMKTSFHMLSLTIWPPKSN